MHTPSALLAFALVSLPVAAHAQHHGLAQPAASRAAVAAVLASGGEGVAGLATAVALTRPGVHPDAASALAPDLEVVDRQQTDIDGDGDLDLLVLVDLGPATVEAKPGMGRGVAVLYREARGYRGETVASTDAGLVAAGYNWGPVESLRAGATPLLHVLYSRADAVADAQGDTVLRFANGRMRVVYERWVTGTPGAHAATLELTATDLDGDGVSELRERVGTGRRIARRTLRWDARRAVFADAAHATGP